MRSAASEDTPEIDALGPNAWLVEELRRRYLTDPASVSEAWRRYFAGHGEFPSGPTPPPPHPAETVPVAPASIPATAPSPPQTAPSVGTPQMTEGLPVVGDDAEVIELRGAAAAIARRMNESKDLPTATSVRTLPAKLIEVNRRILNNQLARLVDGGKASFTHVIGWAVVRALRERPGMNVAYLEHAGTPYLVRYRHVNLGLAMDVARKDGSRSLLVPVIRHAEEMDFRTFWESYEELVAKVRTGRVTPDDFAGTTATLTNPGTVGTVQSVPRLMPDQGVIVGVGAIGFPPEYQGADPATLAASGVGKTLTVTSTYDHRVIQGAESGLFLRRIHELLLGEDGFYEEIFDAMQIPYVPARWAVDSNPPPGSREWAEKQARVFQLINMYRVRGHLIADLDPLRQSPPRIHRELDPLTYGLTIWDLDREFATGGLAGRTRMTLGSILGVLRDAYCRTTGIEYTHIQEADQKVWIQEHVEGVEGDLTDEDRRRILRRLNEAEAFERFLHTKYLGAKRFSLEGAETLVPLLDALLDEAADSGMEHAAMGMAHRGRLNVLANVVGKELTQIFQEFEGVEPDPDDGFSGDVKYHLGATGRHRSPTGTSIDVSIANNPSHLEAVDPVLEGIVKAKQDDRGDGAEDLILPILVHGDAAFAGQGVVAETLNLSQLEGYATGGTVHVVVNNQVGFTTSSVQARSSQYATDVAKMVQAPIFHVNGDDPEAVVRATRLAFRFRQAFHKDVVIDLICYRRLGHNEGDEPTYTQPRMYALIKEHRSVRDLYLDRLVRTGVISDEEAADVITRFRTLLDEALAQTKTAAAPKPTIPAEAPEPASTAITTETLRTVEEALRRLPEGFVVHPKLARVLEARHETFAGGKLDWGLAEAEAFGSLAMEGRRVRLAGEDSGRGTFSHRHAVLVDYVTEDRYVPLQHIAADQAPVDIIDSLLSEFAALGFEYGYSVESPGALVLWEAQYGDFANGAQVIIDQFITSGHDKWLQESALTMLLPHGYEGQGPEHSSARIERFLQNAAEDNIRLVVPTTTAQYFHVLRRQALWEKRRPLIMATPKSMLRLADTFSEVHEFTEGRFRKVLPDPRPTKQVRRVLLCSGKLFYDLDRYRAERDVPDVAVVRFEQIYPFPTDEALAAIEPYGDAELVWVQEEPANMGAWRFMSRALFTEVGRISRGIYRPESASPATGSSRVHAQQQRHIVERAFS